MKVVNILSKLNLLVMKIENGVLVCEVASNKHYYRKYQAWGLKESDLKAWEGKYSKIRLIARVGKTYEMDVKDFHKTFLSEVWGEEVRFFHGADMVCTKQSKQRIIYVNESTYKQLKQASKSTGRSMASLVGIVL